MRFPISRKADLKIFPQMPDFSPALSFLPENMCICMCLHAWPGSTSFLNIGEICVCETHALCQQSDTDVDCLLSLPHTHTHSISLRWPWCVATKWPEVIHLQWEFVKSWKFYVGASADTTMLGELNANKKRRDAQSTQKVSACDPSAGKYYK